MASLLYALSLGLLLPCTVRASAVAWSYGSKSSLGPNQWKTEFPHCGGVFQSPINIATKNVLYDPSLSDLDISMYANTDKVTQTLHNVGGHTAEVKYSGEPIYLTGGNLPGRYKVDQFHFHWGQVDSRGSEHGLDGEHAPMEMHIVHHLSSIDNLTEAMSQPHSLAVLAFFFKVGKHNAKYVALLDHFDKISRPDSHTDLPVIQLSTLITDTLDYYRYFGSLTTPPCYETVIWSLATEHIEISESQINKFRGLLKDGSGSDKIVDDFRPVQLLHSRTVTTTLKNPGGGVDCLHLSLASLILCGLLSIWFCSTVS